MKKHWQNLKYIIRHKWYVMIAGFKYRVWWHQLLLHDLSKFSPAEWTGYANKFFSTKDQPTPTTINDAFRLAWNHHQKRNKHHWQYWVGMNGQRSLFAIKMPERFVREMVADWAGASLAIRGYDDTLNWYEKNRADMVLHEETRELVERLIGYKPQTTPSILAQVA